MSTAAAANEELPAFVHRHLDTIAKREGFSSYNISSQAGSKPGDGFMAIVVAVEMRGPRKDARTGTVGEGSLSLMCKLLPASVERQEIFHSKDLFEREVHFYATILPMLVQFQLDKGLTEQTGFFGFPQCYAAIADEATNEYVIIMRDLRSIGYELWDKLTPMPYDNAKLLFEQLGRMNGVSLAIRAQRADLFGQIRQLDDMLIKMFKTDSMSKMCTPSFEQAVELMEKPEHKSVVTMIRDKWMSILTECSQVTDSYGVLGHGDSWNNNMMFAGQDKIVLLDWQVCRYASPGLDVSYFLGSSTDKALRKNYDKLIGIYYQNLADVVRACGSDPEKLMPFAEFQNQLKKYGRFGLTMAPLLLQVIVSDSTNIVDMDEMAKEMSKTEVDLTKLEFAKFNPASIAKYRQRLGDVIDDAKTFGWI